MSFLGQNPAVARAWEWKVVQKACMSLSQCITYHQLYTHIYIFIYIHISSITYIIIYVSSFSIILVSFILICHHLANTFIPIYQHLLCFLTVYHVLDLFVIIYQHISSFQMCCKIMPQVNYALDLGLRLGGVSADPLRGEGGGFSIVSGCPKGRYLCWNHRSAKGGCVGQPERSVFLTNAALCSHRSYGYGRCGELKVQVSHCEFFDCEM